MRLDRLVAEATGMSRKDSTGAIRGGLVTVDGAVIRKPDTHVSETSLLTLRGKPIAWQQYHYLMLNKPENTLSTTDPDPRSVMKLIPEELYRREMFPCGRLDVDTVGLLLITDDGPLAHELLSPRHHAEKVYYFRCEPAMTEDAARHLEAGVMMDGELTKPSKIVLSPDGTEGEITLTEGKFHQIKRMAHAAGCEITFLERRQFGTLTLDGTLGQGECRPLTEEEIASLRALAAAQTGK